MKDRLRLFLYGQSRTRIGGSQWKEAFPNAAARGLALFLGGFCLLNLTGDHFSEGFDANLWWLDLRLLPQKCYRPFMVVTAICLLAFCLRWSSSSPWRAVTVAWLSLVTAMALANCVQFYLLMGRGSIRPGIPFPLSMLVAIALGLIVKTAASQSRPDRKRQVLPMMILVSLMCTIGFPLLQMFCFGKTSYERPADAGVVFGARVYADGRLSDALTDRMNTACRLYREGTVKRLVLSGGPGDGATHETESMRQHAIRKGVRPEDILVDKDGLNTQATVRNSLGLFEEFGAKRVLVVSHFYHLPRIKLTYQRMGREVYTVPARESYMLRQLPYNILREIVALWVYYLRPVLG